MISKHVGICALVLMCLCITAQCFEFKSVHSSYRKKLVFLSTMLRQESIWRYVFDQTVYFDFDKHLYRDIIEKDLMKNAKEIAVIDGVEKNAEKKSTLINNTNVKITHEKPVGEPVKPRGILKNLFSKWYRVGSLLKMTFQVMQTAFRCLTYKHVSILLTLLRVEIGRKDAQHRAENWSRKTRKIVADIIMKMAALQFTDGILLRLIKFLNIYEKGLMSTIKNKFNYTPYLDDMLITMKMFISRQCYRFNPTDTDLRVSGIWQIAKELDVSISTSLLDPAESKLIDDETFKEMFKNSTKKITEHFANLPSITGLARFQWNSILHFDKDTDTDGDDDEHHMNIKY